MKNNFEKLYDRIIDALSETSIFETSEALKTIKGNVMTIGTGGSYPIAKFMEKILEEKNNCTVQTLKPRDLLYKNTSNVKHVIAFTYSGKTASIVKALKSTKCKKIVFTHDEAKFRDTIKIVDNNYKIIDYSNLETKEKSFISLASTLAPMFLMYNYVNKTINVKKTLTESEKYIEEKSKELNFNEIQEKRIIEVFTGDNTYVAGTMLESMLIESGIPCIVHEKNDYSHGRPVLNYQSPTALSIYLQNGKEIAQDKSTKKYIASEYENNITLQSKNNGLLGELELTVKATYLVRKIAEHTNRDLSRIKYPPKIGEIHYFKGNM